MQPRIDNRRPSSQFRRSWSVRRLSFGQPEPWLLARLAELNGDSVVPFAAQEFGGTVNRAVRR